MKFKIYNGGAYEDSFVVEGDTIEEIREIANREIEKRGWENCWSEQKEE